MSLKKRMYEAKPSKQIEVTDSELNQTTTYDSINEAARALNINHARIVMYFSLINRSLIKVDILLKSSNFFSMSFYVNITGAFRVYGYLKGRHKSIGRLILLLTKDRFSSCLIICVVHNYK